MFPESQSLDQMLLEQVHFAMEADASEYSKALNKETTNPSFDNTVGLITYQWAMKDFINTFQKYENKRVL